MHYSGGPYCGKDDVHLACELESSPYASGRRVCPYWGLFWLGIIPPSFSCFLIAELSPDKTKSKHMVLPMDLRETNKHATLVKEVMKKFGKVGQRKDVPRDLTPLPWTRCVIPHGLSS